MSASVNCVAWKSAIAEPNCLRSLVYLIASSRQRWAPPNEQAPMLSRPPSRPIIAMRKPSPSAPTRFPTGTRTSSKLTCAVGCECQPSFFSRAPKLTPGMSFSITSAVMPFGPSSPVRTIATITSFAPAPEMNAFEPETT